MFDDERAPWVPLRQLGWAFLLAWVFCVFYTNAAGGIAESAEPYVGSLAKTLYYAVLPLGASVATLIAIVVAEPRFGAPTSHRSLVAAAPLLTAASTPFMFLVPADPLAGALIFGAGSIATGIGSALLWVMWGEYYAIVPREKSELLAPVSAVSAALLVLFVSAMDGWVAIAVAATFPLLSGLCLNLVWTREATRAEERLVQASHLAPNAPGRRPLAGLGRTGLGIFAVFAIVSVAGMIYPSRIEGTTLQAILVFSALMMALVAVMAVSGPRRISLFFLYRWMCPTLVVGFAALILLGSAGGIIAVAASLGGRFTFCLIAQIYFANYAAAGRATPAQASSLGWLFVHTGDLAGVILWTIAEPAVAALPAGITWVSVLCIVALVIVTMLVMGETSTFLRIPEGSPLSASRQASKKESAEAGTASRIADPVPATAHSADLGGTAHSDGPAGATQGIAEAADLELPPAQAQSSDTRIDALAREHSLTPREAEVFALLAQGRSIPYIRDELIISRETAATHAKHIYAKLGVHSRQELIDLVRQ